ncbi:DUF294 nucleotidyltransferase-like domain-containing protein [Candidatus Protochlamydia amoebophila]|nr:DUF294 nucleotidyltransferase-like domain-containing protein [Candidatus Protochlamydia amoebophila]
MQSTHPISAQPFSELPSKLEDLKSLDAILATIKKEKYSRAVEQFNFFMAFLTPHAEKEVLKKTFDCLLLLVPVVEFPKEIEEGVRLLLNLASDSCFAEEQKQLATELAKWHYKQGKQEQLNKKQVKDPINALHYAVKAQSISMASAESQRQASRYFKVASTSLSVFKQRLKKARAEDKSQEVVQLITNLETRFKAICCKGEQHALIKLFYKQVRKLIAALFSKRGGQKPIEASGLHHLKPTMDRYLNSKSFPTTCFITTTYRKNLDTYRASFYTLYQQAINPQEFTISEVRTLQREVSAHLIKLLHALVEDAIAILGDPPCSYDLRAMGSLAKEEICPYSDLEWCILMEAIEHRPYFVKLARLLELQIIALGEDPAQGLPVFTCIGTKHRSGFHVDSGGNPAVVPDLIHTPDGLAQMQKIEEYPSNSHSNTLRKTISFHQNTLLLFSLYQMQMRTYLDEELPQTGEVRRKCQAVQLLTDRLQAYEQIWCHPFKEKIIDLKKNYTELLHHLLNDLSLYFGMEETNTLDLIDALVKKEIFTVESGFLLQEAVAAIYLKRVGLHFICGEQKEEVNLDDPLIDDPLSEKKFLTKIYWLVLRPLYRKLKFCLSNLDSHQLKPCISKLDSHFQKIDLLRGAYYEEELRPDNIENLKPWIAHFVHHLISRQQAKAFDPDQAWHWHEAYYQRLSQITFAEPLRETYLKVLNSYPAEENLAALSAHLASIPNPSGVRQSRRLEEEQLQQAILAMTTDHPDPDDPFQVKIRCPAVPDARYLSQAVCKQILEGTGNLKRQYKSAHPVASATHNGYQLHFKQKPTHPLLEYAIHALTARIAGHLSPPTELARFEVDIKGRKRIYPVLISKTIQGQTLENAAKLDIKQLTWACLCALLTRPGDGRFSNYVVEEKTHRIFCVDNDISFVEPVIHYFFGHKVHFSSALFCLDAKDYLDSEVLQAFLRLEPNLILSSWLEDLIQKDAAYRELQLFNPKEEEQLYEENPEDRFKGTLLLRSGTVTNVLVQFYHLQDCLRQALKDKKRLSPLDLLPYLVNLHGSQKQTLDRWVYSKYQQAVASSLVPKQRLQKAIDRQVNISLTSAQADAASFGKPPTFEEIQQREEYSPEKAQSELFAFTLNRCASHVLFGENQEGEWIEADFRHMVKGERSDQERQRLVLHALIFLMKNKGLRPKKVTLMNCAVLDHTTLKPFLHVELTYLNVSGCPFIKEEAILEIEKCSPNLKTLYLNCCAQLRAFEKPRFPLTPTYLQFAKLEELQLKRCVALASIQLDAPLLHILKADKNPQLKTLFFTTFAPYVTGSFTRCPTLDLETIKKERISKILREIKNPEIDSGLLFRLYRNDLKLTLLDLSGRGINDKEVEVIAQSLASNTTLKSLNLGYNQIGDQGAEAIAQSLASNTTLETLGLNNNQISDRGAKAISKALASNNTLETLYLEYNLISDEGAEAIAQALASNTILRKLFLSGNHISDQGAKAIFKALASNTVLKKLTLSYNQISDEGAKAISKALASNNTLETLFLEDNQISDEGMEAIAQALASNTTLRDLYLNRNQISDKGMEALAQTLASNTALRILRLNNNQISDKGIEALAQALASNKALRELSLNGNQISDKGMEALARTLASHKYFRIKGTLISIKRL